MASPEAVVQRCSAKKMLLNITQNSQENYCEFCEIFKNTYFEEHLWTTASASQILQNPSPNIAKQQQQEEEV